MAAPAYPTTRPIRWIPTASSSSRVRSSSVRPPTTARQFGSPASPIGTPLPAARINARVITRGLALTLATTGHGCEGVRHLAQRLGPEGQQVDRVLGLDVNLIAARVAQDAAHRRRHHAVAVGIAENHHAAADAGIADQVARIGPSQPERRPLPAVIPDFSGGDTDHERSQLEAYHKHPRLNGPAPGQSVGPGGTGRRTGPVGAARPCIMPRSQWKTPSPRAPGI